MLLIHPLVFVELSGKNKSNLKDSAYVDIIDQLIMDSMTLRPLFTSVGAYWDHLKVRIRTVTKPYGKKKAALQPAEIHRLEEKLKYLRSVHDNNNYSNSSDSGDAYPSVGEELQLCKERLGVIQRERLEGLFVRSRLEKEFW